MSVESEPRVEVVANGQNGNNLTQNVLLDGFSVSTGITVTGQCVGQLALPTNFEPEQVLIAHTDGLMSHADERVTTLAERSQARRKSFGIMIGVFAAASAGLGTFMAEESHLGIAGKIAVPILSGGIILTEGLLLAKVTKRNTARDLANAESDKNQARSVQSQLKSLLSKPASA